MTDTATVSAAEYESAALVIAAASEKDWQGLHMLLENTDPSLLLPAAFGLAVLSGQAIVPGSDMLSPLAIIQRLLRQPAPRN